MQELLAKMAQNILAAAADYEYYYSEFHRLNCAWIGKPAEEGAKLQKEFNEAHAALKSCQDQLFKFVRKRNELLEKSEKKEEQPEQATAPV